MRRTCRKIEMLLPDYLDGTLNPRDVSKVEAHLSHCAACRDDVQAQREWLDQLKAAAPHFASPELMPGLNGRIMAAIQAESTADDRKSASSARPAWQRITRMPSLAGIAVVVVILLVAWQVVPHLLLNSGTSLSSLTQIAENAEDSRETKSAGNQDTSFTTTAGAPQMGGWLISYGMATDVTTAAGSDKGYMAESCQLTPDSESMLDHTLAAADDIRIARQADPSGILLILAAYPEDDIQTRLNTLKNALSTCETPVQTEIIRADDLQSRVSTVDPELFSQLFPDGALQMSWIFILIGA